MRKVRLVGVFLIFLVPFQFSAQQEQRGHHRTARSTVLHRPGDERGGPPASSVSPTPISVFSHTSTSFTRVLCHAIAKES